MAKQFYGEAANFPGAPENFDPSDPLADKVAAIAQREHVVREKMVKIETAKVSARSREVSRRDRFRVLHTFQCSPDPAVIFGTR